jgi:hypothetical protein
MTDSPRNFYVLRITMLSRRICAIRENNFRKHGWENHGFFLDIFYPYFCIFSIIRGRGTVLRLTARVRPYVLRRYVFFPIRDYKREFQVAV